MKKEIIKKIREHLSLRKEILFAYLYGSFLEGKDFKDIDVGIYLDEEKLTKIDSIDYEITLSLSLQKEIKIPFDVKIINLAPLSFKYHVTLGYLLFCRDEAKREEFLCHTWMLYFDFLPAAKNYLREVFYD